MLDLLRREHHAESLTPPERAFLKFFWSALLSGLYVGIEAVLTSLQALNGVSVDWRNVLRDALVLALLTIGHTILGYLKASTDTNLKEDPQKSSS